MPFFSSHNDGASLYYADHRPSVSIDALEADPSRKGDAEKNASLVFLHGWPMSSETLLNKPCQHHLVLI